MVKLSHRAAYQRVLDVGVRVDVAGTISDSHST